MSSQDFQTPPDSSSENELSLTSDKTTCISSTPNKASPRGAHATIVIDEEGILSNLVHKKRDLHVDVDRLSIASVAAVAR